MVCYLIGAGMGTASLLTAQAREVIEKADTVLGTARLAKSLIDVRINIEALPFSQLAQRALECSGTTAILLSGDTGFFSAAKSLGTQLQQHCTVHVLPGMSSLQVFCAKLGTAYDDVFWLSLHGRTGSPVAAVSYHSKVFALTGGIDRAHTVCEQLAQAGLSHIRVSIGENLGAQNERIVSGSPEQLARERFADLSVMLIENTDPANASRPLRDGDFVRGDVPMTKQEVRWLAADLLAVTPTDVVYDIGAGTGSVTMELARRACLGKVYAVECKPDALDLIERNRRQTKNYHVTVVQAMAPDGLDTLPPPDCVFIGGSRGNMAHIVQAVIQKNPAVRIVISAIALESTDAAMRALQTVGIEPEISCVNISRARKIGSYHMMTAQNPVYLIGGNLL